MNYLILIPKEKNIANIAPNSGIAARRDDASGQFHIYYEGNLYGASNMNTYGEKLLHAASRINENYPTISRIVIPKEMFEENFEIVGELDFDTARELLRDRRNNGLSETQCILKNCKWLSTRINGWANEDICTEGDIEVHTLNISTIDLAIPENSPATQVIKDLLDELRCEGTLFSYKITPTGKSLRVEEGTPHGDVWTLPTDQDKASETLLEDRRKAAEAAFDAHIEETNENVEATDGWISQGDYYHRVYYVNDPEKPEGPTTRASFGITFEAGKSTITPN